MKRKIYTKNQLFDPIISSPAYSLNKFSYCLKLNQRVQGAMVYRDNTYDFRHGKRETKKQNQQTKQNPLPIITEKYVNRKCFPPFVGIRRWLYFIRPVNRYINCFACSPCKKEKQKGTNQSALLKLWTKK